MGDVSKVSPVDKFRTSPAAVYEIRLFPLPISMNAQVSNFSCLAIAFPSGLFLGYPRHGKEGNEFERERSKKEKLV